MDAAALSRRTGWSVAVHPLLGSTNDEATRLRDRGAPARTAVVALAQSAGRGREGRTFASPAGGLYASLLVDARLEDLPGPATAAVAVASAEAVERVAGVAVQVKWPNDLWIRRRKVAGILLESAGADRPVVAGIGINVRAVPEDLPEDVRAEVTAVDLESSNAPSLEDVLAALLERVDVRFSDLRDSHRRAGVEEAWRERLALVGERIRYRFGGRLRSGVLLGAGIVEGLEVEDDEDGRVWRRAEHVQDVRPEVPSVGPGAAGAPGARP